MKKYICWALGLLLALGAHAQTHTVYLDEIDLDRAETGWRTPQKNRSVMYGPIKLAGKVYSRGVGTHAHARLPLQLDGQVERFQAIIGFNDTISSRRGDGHAVNTQIFVDGKKVFERLMLRQGEAPFPVDIPLLGAKELIILLMGYEGNNHTHIDLAEARFTLRGAAPVFLDLKKEAPYILTPAASPKPRINGAKVVGLRPGSPLIHRMAVSGERPMKFSASPLPQGVQFDVSTGVFSGTIAQKGTYAITLTAENKKGKASQVLKLKVGDTISLTPPMGWNSWNCWGMSVTADKIRQTADLLVSTGLADYGFAYVNIDDGWQGHRTGKNGALAPNEKFGDMKALADYIHAKGLRAGLYSTPWATSYGGMMGGSCDTEEGAVLEKRRGFGVYAKHREDAEAFAEWGYDYLKYDWGPIDVPHTEAMGSALRKQKRDIVYSLSNSAPFAQAGEWAKRSQVWRTTGDIIDTWMSLYDIGFQQAKWQSYGGPGHWNDPDMLVVGHVGWSSELHATRLSPSEQYLHVSHWCMLAAPLLLGCDLSKLDAFTLNLLTNAEVLEINQDPLGIGASPILTEGEIQVWKRPLEDGSVAVAVYNLGYGPQKLSLTWQKLGLKSPRQVRDLWRQQDVKPGAELVTPEIPVHGVALYRIWPKP